MPPLGTISAGVIDAGYRSDSLGGLEGAFASETAGLSRRSWLPLLGAVSAGVIDAGYRSDSLGGLEGAFASETAGLGGRSRLPLLGAISTGVIDPGYKSDSSKAARMKHSHLKRLERIWREDPIFFVTTNTDGRKRILAKECAANILVEEWKDSWKRHGWRIGRYVVMPDHVHFFCRPDLDSKSLSDFMMAWKQWTSKRIIRECGMTGPVWQAEFFDHLVRNADRYEEKREYVIRNPVSAKLVSSVEEWPWQGEIEELLQDRS